MLQLQNISKHFNDKRVLHDISLCVEQGEIVCLLGPSGCGKTTLLRIITGLEKADRGKVKLNGAYIDSVPVHKRGFGLMFQDFALFPHMNVADNIAFGLRQQNYKRQAIQERIRDVLNLVGLESFAKRDVTELSGGEQQRVALARSLAPGPKLLMLDEPLGSLDAALRERLAIDLRKIIRATGVTAIYVTHDQQEAFAIADRVIVMNKGKIEQSSPPEELYLRPSTRFVADFLGLRNIIPITNTSESHSNHWIAETALGEFSIDEQNAECLLLHPAFLDLTPRPNDAFVFMVTSRVFRGNTYQLSLEHEICDITLTASVLSYSVWVPSVKDTVYVTWREGGIIPLC